MNRSHYRTIDSITHLWNGLKLPPEVLQSTPLHLPDADSLAVPSAFKIGHLAQASITLTALLASLIYSERRRQNAKVRDRKSIPVVTVPLQHALLEFRSELFHTINGNSLPSPWGPLSGLHPTRDGYVRVHDNFPNHGAALRKLLGVDENADRKAVSAQMVKWDAVDLESQAVHVGAVVSALRSFEEWDRAPQAGAIMDFPILVKRVDGDSQHQEPEAVSGWPDSSPPLALGDKPLRGIRVVELSRVIAGPVAGRTLAAHGADVLWVTSPNLPDLPSLDSDMARGKRSVQLDLNSSEDHEKLMELIDGADVVIQGYRPGSLAARGLSPSQMSKRRQERNGGKQNRGLVFANLSAYGPNGPWRNRRGFDSLVQTCSGMNVAEARYFKQTEPPARPTPCQALDHASGYFLAAGVMAALVRMGWDKHKGGQEEGNGGVWEVDVSLAGTGRFLRSLGVNEDNNGDAGGEMRMEDVPAEFLEERECGFGMLKAVRHSAKIEGVDVGWEVMPGVLGGDEARWL